MLGPRSLWVFDFDGTLSSFVPERLEETAPERMTAKIRGGTA
jgi:trehalose-6-phosphatase